MEETMRKLIIDELDKNRTYWNDLDVLKFLEDVLDSFKSSLSSKHYVVLYPVDIDMYYTRDEQLSFRSHGFHRGGSDSRYCNVFFATDSVVVEMSDALQNEGMTVEDVHSPKMGGDVKVVTLNGVNDSNYFSDYEEMVCSN